jgi:hypothetical protein
MHDSRVTAFNLNEIGSRQCSLIWGWGAFRRGVAATLFPLISLTTAAGGMVWFSERLSLWQLAGGVLILGAAGAVAVSLGARETASPTRGAGKMDANDDLKVLSRDQLIEEVKRLRAGVRKHRDNSGHDLCWYHPETPHQLHEASSSFPALQRLRHVAEDQRHAQEHGR